MVVKLANRLTLIPLQEKDLQEMIKRFVRDTYPPNAESMANLALTAYANKIEADHRGRGLRKRRLSAKEYARRMGYVQEMDMQKLAELMPEVMPAMGTRNFGRGGRTYGEFHNPYFEPPQKKLADIMQTPFLLVALDNKKVVGFISAFSKGKTFRPNGFYLAPNYLSNPLIARAMAEELVSFGHRMGLHSNLRIKDLLNAAFGVWREVAPSHQAFVRGSAKTTELRGPWGVVREARAIFKPSRGQRRHA